MKQIIIALLIVIVLILGYNFYSNYKRFHAPGTDYVSSQKIDENYHDKTTLIAYHQAVEALNGYVRMSWANDGIDVRNPKSNNQDTKAVVEGYTKQLGIVKLLENKLAQSAKIKNSGLTDKDVIDYEESGFSGKDYNEFMKRKFLLDSFKSNSEKYSLKLGDKNAFIFELQKVLTKKGYNIPTDGVFEGITFAAIKTFEEKNGLYPDGKIDEITLNYLLR